MQKKTSWRWASLTLCVLGVAGCSSPDLSGPSTIDPQQLPWQLSLSAHAITMATHAPYDTLQVTATITAPDGTAIPNAPPAMFTTSDSSVRVSTTGLLTARVPHDSVFVFATVVYRGIRLSDTAVVTVTTESAPPAFQQLQFQFPAGDSAKIAAFNAPAGFFYGFPSGKVVQIGALGPGGVRIPQALVAVRVNDALQTLITQTVDQYITTDSIINWVIISTARIGAPTTLYASATVYGVTRRDSLKLQIADQLALIYTLRRAESGNSGTTFTLSPQSQQAIAVGGYVMWANESSDTTDSMDVVFDDPTVALPDTRFLDTGGGNIPPFGTGSFLAGDDPATFVVSRQFLRAGSFPWHSVRTGVSGKVVVQ